LSSGIAELNTKSSRLIQPQETLPQQTSFSEVAYTSSMAEITRRGILLGCTAAVALPEARAANTNADKLLTLDATGQAELVRKGEISAFELVDTAIRHIEQLNLRINAVVLEQ
jgi:hypothetical protein